jgi:preprotein translocase subunit SecG
MYTFLVVVQVLAAVAVIGLVLIQHGKGADAGAAFGSGASGTVFGARGSANFLTRATAVCATIFFVVSLSLAYLMQGRKAADSVVDTVQPPAPASPTAPEGAPPVNVVPAPQSPAAPAAEPQKKKPEVPE